MICFVYIQIFYLDRLNRRSNCWNTYPRAAVWHVKEVNKALQEDRVASGDFGGIGVCFISG